MKTKFALLVLVLAAAGCSNSVPTPPEPVENHTLVRSVDGVPTQIESRTIQLTAAVQSIDYKTRQVVLKRSDGTKVTVTASPEVKRLREIKKGDQVVLSYYESLTYEVRKPTIGEEANARLDAVAVGKTDSALPPAAGGAVVSKLFVTVNEIDLKDGTVVLKTPEGELVSMKAKYPENLKLVKVGDSIAVTYSEVLAISIEPVGRG